MNQFQHIEEIKLWKEKRIVQYENNPMQINNLHDTVMKNVFNLLINELGPPPCPFCWFITGSGGRMEQTHIADQDHGIIFTNDDQDCETFFHHFGKRLVEALYYVGYPYCDGNVMSSNPLWCKSLFHWEKQIGTWLEDASFASIRNVLIFFDARCLMGETDLIGVLKHFVFRKFKEKPFLLRRFAENTIYLKKAIGPFGQMLVEEKGKRSGMINIKQMAYLPYVNSIRLLALKEEIFETSTIERIQILKKMATYRPLLTHTEEDFLSLLHYRLKNSFQYDYEDSHYIHWGHLRKAEKQELKAIIRRGRKLQQLIHKGIKQNGGLSR